MSAYPQHLPPTIPTNWTTPGGFCTPSTNLTNCTAGDNAFAQCIKSENALLNRITQDPVFPLRKLPARYWHLKSLPFDEMPPDALRLNAPVGSPVGLNMLSMPNPDQFYVVMQYQVPPGYDGVINVTWNRFVPQTGPAFQDGSGMLTWALGINNTLALNYTQLGIEMGNNAVLGPVTKGGGIRIKANDLIQWFVAPSAAALTGGLDANGIVVAGIQGWLYPNR